MEKSTKPTCETKTLQAGHVPAAKLSSHTEIFTSASEHGSTWTFILQDESIVSELIRRIGGPPRRPSAIHRTRLRPFVSAKLIHFPMQQKFAH